MGSEITVCLVAFRSRPHLDGLFASLDRQTVPAERTVVLINGEDDGVTAFLSARGGGIETLHFGGNIGFAAGMNRLISLATTRFVFLVNPDVILRPDHFERLLAVMLEAAPPAAVGGKLLRPKGRRGRAILDSTGFLMQRWFRVVDRGAGTLDQGLYDRREPVLGLSAAAMLADRQALLSVAEAGQVFDEDFFVYKEDVDLALRLREAGLRAVYEPSAVAEHVRGFGGGGRARVAPELRRLSFRNRYLLLWKHGFLRREGVRPLWVLAFEVVIIFAIIFSEPRTLLGFFDARRLRTAMVEKRRQRAAARR